MKNFALFTALAVLGSGCAAGGPEDEPVESQTEGIYASCESATGLKPTKASLAVAMANELRRWEPLTDLTRGWSNGLYQVMLSSAGLQQCAAMGSSCSNTKAILGLQDNSVSQVISQNLFNPTAYREDLLASFGRQRDRIEHLKKNYPWQLPAPHKLTKIGGPTNLGRGDCGPHWVFRPTTPWGSTYSHPANLSNALYFFGHPENSYLAFTVMNGDVAIDPIDGDNSSPVTTSGSCPTYLLDRVYNPTHSLNGTCCVSVLGRNGALQSIPRAAGYLGCKAGVVPWR